MITDLPDSVIAIFLLTVALTFFLFVNAARNKPAVILILFVWLAVTGFLSYEGIFQDTSAVPPRLILVMAPALLVIVFLLLSGHGRKFTDTLDLKKLTLVHIVRVPVEFILYSLAAHKLIPGLMTFAGRNFDIFSGITAPIIYFACFKNSLLRNRALLLTWNIICLGLLLNIVINALLSAPTPFQKFAFEQPNVAILYFPFTWLPCFIVMIVLYSQLAAIRQLLKKKQ
jgi:hypothetical protein